jgi:hypothetical protein
MRGLATWLVAFLIFFVFVPGLAGVAWAQEGATPSNLFGLLSADTMVQVTFWLAIALGLVELAKRVCAKLSGERDDKIANYASYALRWALDLIAGKTGKPSDPSLIRRE